jgi:hypothetical protein
MATGKATHAEKLAAVQNLSQNTGSDHGVVLQSVPVVYEFETQAALKAFTPPAGTFAIGYVKDDVDTVWFYRIHETTSADTGWYSTANMTKIP